MYDSLRNDIRYAYRQMVRAPMITLVTIAILAVGIGVNSALFSFVDTLLLKPVPGVVKTDRLVELRRESDHEPPISYMSYKYLRDTQASFDGIAAATTEHFIVNIDGNRTQEWVNFVNGDYFTTLRPIFILGHAPPLERDEVVPAVTGVVISYGLWNSAFGGANNIIGKTINVGSAPMVITGVLSRDYFGNATLYAPLSSSRAASGAGGQIEESNRFNFLAARLRPDVSIERARAQLATVNRRLPRYSGFSFEVQYPTVVTPLRLIGSRNVIAVLGPIGLIGNATIFILLIAAANVSVLLLSRAIGRRREIGIRLAMGAERRRLVRQLLTEGVILALLASIAGLFTLTWFARGLQRLFFPTMPIVLIPSWHTIIISLACAILTGVLFAIAPALHATRVAVTEALKDGAGGTDRQTARVQRAFVIAEVALSMALVCATGIFADAAVRAAKREVSYLTSARVIVADMSMGRMRVSSERKRAAIDRIVQRGAAVPGVQRVTYADHLPGYGGIAMANVMGAGYAGVNNGGVASDSLKTSIVDLNPIGPNVFSTLGVQLLYGREINASDIATSQRVALVDESFARSRWPGRNPVGQTIGFQKWRTNRGVDTSLVIVTVIGVVPQLDVSSYAGSQPPALYLASTQFPDSADATIIVSTTVKNGERVVPALLPALRAVDREIPIANAHTLAYIQKQKKAPLYKAGLLAGVAGFIALTLACVGLYATISYGLSHRVREIGVRRALGADDRDVVYTFFQEGMRLALLGFAIGIPVALAAMKIGVAEKFGVQTLTTPSIATVMAVLLMVCALASWLPARRAASVDALTALKQS